MWNIVESCRVYWDVTRDSAKSTRFSFFMKVLPLVITTVNPPFPSLNSSPCRDESADKHLKLDPQSPCAGEFGAVVMAEVIGEAWEAHEVH